MLFRTIRAKLLFSFFLFLAITIFIVGVNIWYKNREDRVNQISFTLSKINLENQIAGKLARDFLIDETINPDFHREKMSSYLMQRDTHIHKIKLHLAHLRNTQELRSEDLKQKMDDIIRKFDLYEKEFRKTIRFIQYRGFKDFGVEGKMRAYIHAIEDIAPSYNLDLGKLLMIRRHEKDFILRKEPKYTQKIKSAIQDFWEDIRAKVGNAVEKKALFKLLMDYQNAFEELVKIEKTIGFTKDQGFRKELAVLSAQIETRIQEINESVNQRLNYIQTQNQLVLGGVFVICISLIIFLAFFITKILSRPIQNLSSSINEVISNNFSPQVEFSPLASQDEIGGLSRDFAFMLEKVQGSIDEIQTKSERIEKKQKLLMESLNYAKKIQQAILPSKSDLQATFKDSFVMYHPMHVVSGDFYWLAQHDGAIFLGVIDCTGHGVPGGFMSMIGHTLLNKVVIEKNTKCPAKILEILDQEVKSALHQQEKRNNDGMEISFCRIEPSSTDDKSMLVAFAGAKSPLIYTKDGKVHCQKGTRRAIGGIGATEQNFECVDLELHSGDALYLGSDGFWDQPSPKRRKYGLKRFLSTLEYLHELPMKDQRRKLKESLWDYMRYASAQRDDITLVGVRL